MDPNPPNLPDSTDQPTPPFIPVPPPQPAPSAWPGLSGGQPPKGRPPWPLIGGIAAALVILALIVVLLLTQGGTTTVLVVPVAGQTATAGSAQATASAGGGSTPSSGTPTATSAATATPTSAPTATPTATPTPTPLGPPATHFVLVQATVNTGTPVVVSCPAGETALSGGWASSAGAPIYQSSRDGNGWQVYANGSNALVNAYVMCLKNDPSVSVTERTASVTVAPSSHDNTFALCNTGEWVAGGGYSMSANAAASGVEVYILGDNGAAWGGYIRNPTGSPQPVTFYAECLHAPGGQTGQSPTASASINPGASNGTQAACAPGEMMSGGGYEEGQNAVVYSASPNSNSAWGVYLQNNGGSANGLSVYAMCLVYI
jgi:hypothetical protein